MKRLFKLFLFVGIFIVSTQSHAQAYKTAVGLRLGSPISLSIKHFLSETKAIEAYVGRRGYAGFSWINANAALQFHKPIESVENLSWYWGAGAGIYAYSFDSGFNSGGASSLSIGVQGYLGLDYKFSGAPVNVSVDWIPSLFLSGYGNGFGADYGAFSVRYILGEGGKK
jgi:hypothetical protein